MIYDVKKYLQRIGIDNREAPSLPFLINLHQAHLYHIPFENLSIHRKEKIILNLEDLYSKIVLRNRGGFCYELNYLFSSLLSSLGYELKVISAGVYNKEGVAGPDFDHMALLVKCSGKEWLCDVGFGDSFIEPVEFTISKVHKEKNYDYRITKHDNYFLLSRSGDRVKWESQYLFTADDKSISEFEPMCHYHQTSPDSHFTIKKVCTIPTETGRVTLSDYKLIITNNNLKNEITFEDKNEFNNLLEKYFKINV